MGCGWVQLSTFWEVGSSYEAFADGVCTVWWCQVTEMLTSTIFDCIIYKGYGQRVANRDHSPGTLSKPTCACFY